MAANVKTRYSQGNATTRFGVFLPTSSQGQDGAAARTTGGQSARRSRICIVEDDDNMRRLLRTIFEGAGYAVAEAATGTAALKILSVQPIDLVTLDLTLRDEDGLALAGQIRAVSDVAIIMVTARAEDIDRIVGLEVGADDYIVKPFNPREVVARVKAVLRRINRISRTSRPEQRDRQAFGDWTIDFEGHELRDSNGTVCPLTTAEFRLLEAFVRHAGRVLSRDFLIDAIGGIDAEPLERSVDTTVSRLRRKIERQAAAPDFIKTVRGARYRFTGHLTAA